MPVGANVKSVTYDEWNAWPYLCHPEDTAAQNITYTSLLKQNISIRQASYRMKGTISISWGNLCQTKI